MYDDPDSENLPCGDLDLEIDNLNIFARYNLYCFSTHLSIIYLWAPNVMWCVLVVCKHPPNAFKQSACVVYVMYCVVSTQSACKKLQFDSYRISHEGTSLFWLHFAHNFAYIPVICLHVVMPPRPARWLSSVTPCPYQAQVTYFRSKLVL